MINPIQKYTGCTTEQVIAFLARDYNVTANAEDFKKVRKQKLVPIYVAAIGYTEILVSNPEYKVYWWEPTIDFVKIAWRMVKSPACRQTLIKAFKLSYREIDQLEYLDAFREHAAKLTEKEKVKSEVNSTVVDTGNMKYSRKVDADGSTRIQRLKK